jgi:hypothetical protein
MARIMYELISYDVSRLRVSLLAATKLGAFLSKVAASNKGQYRPFEGSLAFLLRYVTL